MGKFLLKKYQYYLDKKLENSTFLVLIIAILIFLVGFCIPKEQGEKLFTKNNILEIKNIAKQGSGDTNILFINGKRYQFILEEIK